MVPLDKNVKPLIFSCTVYFKQRANKKILRFPIPIATGLTLNVASNCYVEHVCIVPSILSRSFWAFESRNSKSGV